MERAFLFKHNLCGRQELCDHVERCEMPSINFKFLADSPETYTNPEIIALVVRHAAPANLAFAVIIGIYLPLEAANSASASFDAFAHCRRHVHPRGQAFKPILL